MNKKLMYSLAAVLLFGCALPLAEAAPKRDCGDRCAMDYSTCLSRARNGAAKKTCRAAHKTCKRTCR